jgi:hypothetical protein
MAQRDVGRKGDRIWAALAHSSVGSEPSVFSSGSIGILWITVTL